jgi:hypothetical protein
MERCKHEVPQLAQLGGSNREVACWLHRDQAPVPAELSLPEPSPTLQETASQVTE